LPLAASLFRWPRLLHRGSRIKDWFGLKQFGSYGSISVPEFGDPCFVDVLLWPASRFVVAVVICEAFQSATQFFSPLL
jgi:hypothetical protein